MHISLFGKFRAPDTMWWYNTSVRQCKSPTIGARSAWSALTRDDINHQDRKSVPRLQYIHTRYRQLGNRGNPRQQTMNVNKKKRGPQKHNSVIQIEESRQPSPELSPFLLCHRGNLSSTTRTRHLRKQSIHPHTIIQHVQRIVHGNRRILLEILPTIVSRF